MLLASQPTRPSVPAQAGQPGRPPAPGGTGRGRRRRCRPRGGGRVLAAGAVLLAVALAGYAAETALHPLHEMLSWFDLRVYAAAGQTVRQAPGSLYTRPMVAGFRFTYTPFAALMFAGWSQVPWSVLTWLVTGASLAALGLTVWLALRAAGWRGRRGLGAALAVTGVALWTEPVQRALHVGQVELLLLALVTADLCLADRRWWKGTGIGLAAGIKLVPLIFIPYLVLTRRFRQAAVATATFGALAGLGFAVLPQASRDWWLRGDFLAADRTGFVGFLANQSLRGMFTRESASLASGQWWWLAAAVLAGVAGLITAARLHRAGLPAAGWLTCALTGLLVSPISWDHHWVWIVPALALLTSAAVRASGVARFACWALAGLAAAAFGAWPMLGRPGPLVPWGVIWLAPGSPGTAGSHPWSSEYHWHGLTWLAGNAYVLAGLAAFAGLAVLARRMAARARPPLPGHWVPGPRTPRPRVPGPRTPGPGVPGSAGPAGHLLGRISA